ncbi:MAG: aldehyde dehydrogenase [Pseudomonadota bacterium]
MSVDTLDRTASGHTLPDGIHIKHPDRIFIGGKWVTPSTSDMIEVVSPNTAEVVARVADAKAADMDRAVVAAQAAFESHEWSALTLDERRAYLEKMLGYLAGRRAELEIAWKEQVGGLKTLCPRMIDGGLAAIQFVIAASREVVLEEEATSIIMERGVIRREPVGVVAAIAPWNGPFQIMANKVAPALIAGCTVVMKPAPETPLEAYIIAEAAEAVGLPPGVINLVCGDRDASDHLVHNPDVDKVSFTGSTAAGKRIASVCGGRLARYMLELGGKSAAIVLDDMPLPEAAAILGRTITMFSGQVCAILSRVIVSRDRHDELARLIGEEMDRVKVSHSNDPTAEMGPIAMRRQLDRVQGYVESGLASGATLVRGGKRIEALGRGYFFEPTLFANVSNDAPIAQEEIFGPVLCLIPAADEADMIRIANDSDFGLSGAVMTHDDAAAYRVASQMRTGTVGQNGLRLDFSLPFGGFKQSGVGRENGVDGILSYTETKVMLLGDPKPMPG